MISFSVATLLLPLATALHVLEEWPGFPRWARRFASPLYSDREYIAAHVVTLVGACLAPAMLWLFPHPWLVFAFFLFWLGPGVFSNAVFHVGATLVSRAYCPGAITGLCLSSRSRGTTARAGRSLSGPEPRLLDARSRVRLRKPAARPAHHSSARRLP